ncbi:glycosyltransferase family 2 protein [Echinicola vietnamensis]|uniref:Glycosyl transferase n=1 Tax=Echinicola vietnamensis (strain DSM 17526 / LMG 23754 / KMM 6221) TaxID=926556 RepID=L0FZV9_ECHVK|nr:glycosyltransferase family A protein [Echinicola vietnamensis]AGA78842.1 glycosyl transferase [Echinicola vietnamensis DSM 17526]
MALISVIIPTYNRAKLLPRAIESVIRQTFKEWELIIVDDGSNDDTNEVVDQFLSDRRVKYIYQENKGVSAARNHGAQYASGKYLCFLDSDDWVKREWLADFFQCTKEGYAVKVIITGYIKFQSDDIQYKKLPREKKYNTTLPGSFLIFRKLFNQLGGYDTKLRYAENTELFFRVNKACPTIQYLQKANLIYNQSTDGGSRNLDAKIESIDYILTKHGEALSNHVRFLYFQILGVGLVKNGIPKKGINYLIKAFGCKPWNMKTLARIIIAYIPSLRKRIYFGD